jgi:hypothetical protein
MVKTNEMDFNLLFTSAVRVLNAEATINTSLLGISDSFNLVQYQK